MDNQNPFLVLGLPSNATTAEIRDVGQRALMRARLLADEDADSLHAIQAAVEALSDPIVRFRAGIEWPALGPKAAELLRTHPKLLDLRTNLGADRSEVIELLCEGESACGANHIRGVFLLMRACAVLTKQANPTPDGGPLPPSGIAKDLLARGLDAWGTATSSTEFWMTQRMRAREFDDPRLGPDEVRRHQDRAMDLALSRFVKLAQDALRRRDAQTCRAIAEGVMSYAPKRPEVAQVLMDVYSPLSGKVTSTLESLNKALSSTKSAAAEPYEALLDRYKLEVSPDIDLMLAVGDLPGTSEELARDGAAEFLRDVAVKAANEADAYQTSSRALLYANRAVSSQSVRKKLIEDKDALAKLSAGAERAAKTKPHRDRLEQAFAQKDLRAVLNAIDALLPLEEPGSRMQLSLLRTKVSSSLATELFNTAVMLSNSGRFRDAMQKLDEALMYETVPSERRIIENARSSIAPGVLREQARGQGSGRPSGCLIPLVLGVSVAGAAIGGATALLLHADSVIATLRSSIAP